MIHAAGAEDVRLDPYRQVGDARWLTARGLFVAEGRLVVERLLAPGHYDVHSIVVTPAAWASLEPRIPAVGCDVYVCDPEVLQQVTGFNFHRGCLALARRPAATPPSALITANRLVALEGVGNPDNVGGIFRAATALGADGILLDPASGDPLYRKAIRTSMGAALTLPWARVDPWPQGLEAFRAAGWRLAALTPSEQAVAVADLAADNDRSRLILVVGSEGPGLSGRTLRVADYRVRIPISAGVDSLNVVVAAAIALDRLR